MIPKKGNLMQHQDFRSMPSECGESTAIGPISTRLATVGDVTGMSDVLREIIARTGRERPHDPAFVTLRYLADPQSIRCTVAVDHEEEILGFQSLIRAAADNAYGVPPGWGIIGTHISPRAHRRGVGTALFEASRAAALTAGVAKIDAYIAADNEPALRYYGSLGFQEYRRAANIIQKVYELV